MKFTFNPLIFILLIGHWSGYVIAQDLISKTIPIHNVDHQYEAILVNALGKIKDNKIDDALSDLEHLVRINPNFKLAQLIYADLLLAQTRPITDFGNFSAIPYENIAALREEARVRWQHYHSPPLTDKIPDIFVQVSNKQKHIILVDLSNSRLYLFRNHESIPQLVNDFYVTIGKKKGFMRKQWDATFDCNYTGVGTDTRGLIIHLDPSNSEVSEMMEDFAQKWESEFGKGEAIIVESYKKKAGD